MTDSNLTDIAGAFQLLRDAIKQTSQGSMDSDKALLELCIALSERVQELEQKYAELVVISAGLHNRTEILHELYHTHFADTTDDGEETKH